MRIEEYAPSCIQWSRDSRRLGKRGGGDIIITPGLNDTWSKKLCGVKINLVCLGNFFIWKILALQKLSKRVSISFTGGGGRNWGRGDKPRLKYFLGACCDP